MHESFDQIASGADPADPGDAEDRHYCMLFDDMILRNLCLIRRRELTSHDSFSCTGCSKDTIIKNLQRRRQALL